jgi:hypothetical protein
VVKAAPTEAESLRAEIEALRAQAAIDAQVVITLGQNLNRVAADMRRLKAQLRDEAIAKERETEKLRREEQKRENERRAKLLMTKFLKDD